MRRSLLAILALVLVGGSLSFEPGNTRAAPIAGEAFQRTWQRTDQPIAAGAVNRTWMWGPEPFSDALQEAYEQAPGGQRQVQYFDKSRMEITDPAGDQSSPWYVTNGLLVVELMTGRMQVGDDAFVERSPAQVNVAGDAGDPLTYAVLAGLRSAPPAAVGEALTQRIDADGQVSDDASLAAYGVTAATRVPETNHAVASPFWNFMTSVGPVWDDDTITTGPLFEDPYYATGLPITEAYWAEVMVGGTPKLVLVQCFERRCLTYTPDNPEGWQVEAGNVGRHYYEWRYGGPEANTPAGQLAQRLKLATSDEERQAALMEVFARLHLGVYTTDGVQLLGGFEQGPNDLYLYDFEVAMAAAALGRGQTWGLHDLSLTLESAGVLTADGQPIPVELLRSALIEAVAQAQADPEAEASLLPLLLYELGLRAERPYDLSAGPELESIRLDALGFLLLLTEISYGLAVDEAPFDGAGSNLPATTNGILTQTQVTLQQSGADRCVFVGDTLKEIYGKTWGTLLKLLAQKVAMGLRLADASLDAIHGMMLAYSVRVSELDDTLSTHYGPAGHEPGAGGALHFRVKVEMLDDVGELLTHCGWLAGIQFPEKGPIPNVKMVWMDSGNLADHGTIECGADCQQTGPDGIATLTFIPKDEARPGEGWQVEETGVVSGTALYQSAFSNNVGRVNEMATGKSGMTRWFVTRHEQPGWNVTMHLEYNVHATWHVQPSGETGYILDEYSRSGDATLRVFIPADAIDGSLDSLPVDGSGNGTFLNNIEDHTEYAAYDLWVYSCAGTWSGSWQGRAQLSPATQRSDGEQFIIVNPFGPPPDLYTFAQRGGPSSTPWGVCGPGAYDSGTARIFHTAPEFSLDKIQPQRFEVGNTNICEDVGDLESGFRGWGDRRPMNSCEAEVTWTIQVERGGPPES